MTESWWLVVALLSVTIVNGTDYDQQHGLTLTNLSETGFNKTTHSKSVKLTWSVHTPLLERFASYRVKCSNAIEGQQNRHWKRVYDPTQQETTIYGLVPTTQYTCCVELYLNHEIRTDSCNTIKLTSPDDDNTITIETEAPAVSTEHAQTEPQGSTLYTEEEVAGLYVVIALLCVLLAVCVLGWLITVFVTCWKIDRYKSRRVKPELEINPRNHIHNPLYTSDYVPSTGPTSHHGNTQSNTTHEYDYVRVREPLSISVRNTRNTRNGDTVVNNHLFQDRARQVTSRLSIQNDSVIPLHYETMASYGNRIAHRVDTNSSTSSP